jgi:hypothetical protein
MADVILENTIPDAHVSTVTDAFLAIGGAMIRLEIDKHDPELRAETTIVLEAKDESESLKDYGERVLRTLGLMAVKAYDKFLDERDRYRPAVEAVAPPADDVDDNAIL